MHTHPGLTTAETKRSPLVAVVALSAVLGSGPHGSTASGPALPLLGAGTEVQHTISWTMYHDGGEEPEVSAGLALALATFWRAGC